MIELRVPRHAIARMNSSLVMMSSCFEGKKGNVEKYLIVVKRISEAAIKDLLEFSDSLLLK